MRRDLATRSVDASPETGSSEIPSSFLAGAADLTLPPTVDERPGADRDTLPPGNDRYAIEELIGRGGMASVYRAFDRQLERRVALKFLERPFGASAAAFLREARAQARVRHDNVLEVYEGGAIDGRPFIAMRHVEGPSPRELVALPLERKLRLLADVAEGLHAAHRAGLVHRDVKPSNVLVEVLPDGDLKPYVADFGIATALEEGMRGAAFAAGTPSFMAPEQRRGGPVDRRSDVYSLGISACQILTGLLPGEGTPIEPFLEPLPADVAAIVRKCVAADPEARYPSARAVAEELRRYLEGDVVEAHAATWAYRMTKFATRHRRLLGVLGIAALLLVGALATAAVFGVLAMRANARAEARRGQAEDLIGFMLGDLRAKLEPASRLEVLDDVGEKALEYFAAVPREELSTTELVRRARALSQIGDVRIRQGNLEGARRPLAESLALGEELVRRDSASREALYELGQSHFWVGYVAWKQGRLEEASARFEEYLAIARALLAKDPASSDYQLEVHYATSNLGSVREARGDLAGAIGAFREALSSIAGLAEKDPSRSDWQFELAAAHNALAVPLQATGRYVEALEHYRSDLEVRERLVAADPPSRRGREFLATSRAYVAACLLVLGRPDEARAQATRAVADLERLVSEDPEHAVRRFKLANALVQLGRTELALGDRAAAAPAFQRSLETLAELVARDPTNGSWQRQLAIANYHLALATPRSREALEQAARAAAILESDAAGPDDGYRRRWTASALLLLGELHTAEGRPTAAREVVERARARLRPEDSESQDLEVLATWLRARLALGPPESTRAVAEILRGRGYRESGFPDPIALGPELDRLAGRIPGGERRAGGG